MKLKRILAIAALLLIGVLYAASLVFALMDSPFARSCLMAALFCTIVVPAVIYGFLVVTGALRKKDDPDE